MAATLTISAAANRAAPRPDAARGTATAGPSLALPLLFTLTGLLALFTAAGWLVACPEILAAYHYTPAAIAVTHLFVLGWLCSTVMGAMYQLVPVALETRLFSERLARIQFAFHAAGFTGMVWGFQLFHPNAVAAGGLVLAAGVILFVYNIARTLMRVPKWNVVATSIASAIGWFLCVVAAGLLIALVRSWPAELPSLAALVCRFDPLGAMHAHAHLGAVGFFTMLIVGVSYKLIPMFTLSELQSRRRAACSVLLLNLGLAGSFATILLRSPWKPVFSLVIIVALGIYGWELRAIMRARKRRTTDWGVRYFLTAVALMFPLSVLAAVLSCPGLPANTCTLQLENVYGFLGLAGVVSFAIIGMLYKIIPFLVWFGAYSRHVGRSRVPALADMYSVPLQIAGYWSFLAGLTLTLGAMEFASIPGVRCGCALLAVSLAVFGINVATMLRHLVRPQLKPLAPAPALRPVL